MSRRAKFFLTIFIVALLGLGLSRLRLDVDVLNLLPADVPAVRGLQLFQQNFSTARELIITLHGDDAETTEAAARSLAEQLRAAPALTRSVTWQAPWQEHPAQAAELLAHLWLNQPPAVLDGFAARLAPTNLPALLNSAREQLATSMSPQDIALLSYDPFGFTRLPESLKQSAPSFASDGTGMFASTDGKFRVLFVEANGDVSNYRTASKWLTEVESVVSHWQDSNDTRNITVRYTGGPAFVSEISRNMEREIRLSIIGTAVFIAVLFWLAHRRLKPMFWLLALLGVILLATLAVGGLLFHSINIISLGFAAILLGLAVDYGVVHYQEALAQPTLTIPEVRRRIGPGIFWAAATTISAFLVLNLGGLPGLGQLGTLVAIGVGLSALTMIFFFLPPLFPGRMNRNGSVSSGSPLPARDETSDDGAHGVTRPALHFTITALLVLFAIVALWNGIPKIDSTAAPLRPQGVPAYAAMDELKRQLNQNREPLQLILTATNETQMAARLDAAQATLVTAQSNHLVSEFLLPAQIWPRPENQQHNRATLAALVARREEFRATALAHGFSETSFGLANQVLDTWARTLAQPGTYWPTNAASRWIFDKAFARTQDELLVCGLVYPATNQPVSTFFIPHSSFAFLSGWELLGPAVFERVQSRLWLLVLPMAALVLLSVWAAFRRTTEIALGLGAMALSGSLLLAVMKLAGWDWNLMSLMALPLVLGTGVDYGIFMQLALRRHNGNLREAHQAVGRALLLCGATAAAGFGSLAWSSNAGMASLGKVCAVGIAGNMLIAVYLLPQWWRVANAEGRMKNEKTARAPSTFYSTTLWRLALGLVRLLPENVSLAITKLGCTAYWHLAKHRREVIVQNLLPVVGGDRAAAEHHGRGLLDNFARKLVDLWRYEAGLPLGKMFGKPEHWELFEQARTQKRGVLIVTPHLGNWEFGAPMLTERGIPLLVVTLVEPSAGLTELRQSSRARQGVETLVIGDDPFAVVEIIRRLEAGAVVALLVDRPVGNSAVEVELFGKPFLASLAAAELARASGCVLLPGIMPRTAHGYAAEFFDPIPYNRAELRDRAARQRLTQQIMRAFEPCIRQHPDQWYHFVPIWPR